MFVQVGTVDRIWVCNDPTLKVWIDIAGEDIGIKENVNTRTFGGQIWRDTVDGVASFKVIRGGSSIVVDNFGTDFIDMKVSDTFTPLTLDKVYNIQDNRSAPPANPTPTDDSSLGYSRGSVWNEQEPIGTAKQWICNAATVGAAEWVLMSGGAGPGSEKEFSSLRGAGAQPHVVSVAYTDLNLLAAPYTIDVQSSGAVFASAFDGTRLTFNRKAVSLANKSYMVTVEGSFLDLSSGQADSATYSLRLVNKTEGNTPYPQSRVGFVMSGKSGFQRRWAYLSGSFMITLKTAGAESVYWQLDGTKDGTAQPANNVYINYFNVTFKEL